MGILIFNICILHWGFYFVVVENQGIQGVHVFLAKFAWFDAVYVNFLILNFFFDLRNDIFSKSYFEITLNVIFSRLHFELD